MCVCVDICVCIYLYMCMHTHLNVRWMFEEIFRLLQLTAPSASNPRVESGTR